MSYSKNELMSFLLSFLQNPQDTVSILKLCILFVTLCFGSKVLGPLLIPNRKLAVFFLTLLTDALAAGLRVWPVTPPPTERAQAPPDR